MHQILKGTLVLLLGLGLAGPAAAALRSEKATTRPSEPWPQSQSDLTPDPNVRFGTLPNGLRYAILPNKLPAGQVSFRLRIDAGSLQESDQQQGVAHFIEHMAFRGSTHIKDNEVFHILERFGAAPGADSNAFTDQSETVFKIDLPKNTPQGVDTALMFLRETASEILFNEPAVDSERAVVLSEERVRDTPAGRLNKAEMAFVFKGQLVGERLPIGTKQVLNTVHAADLRAFYDAYYRPERATLVIVGDIKVETILDKIKEGFAGWRGRGVAGGDPPLGPPVPRGQEIATYAEPGAPTVATLEWTRPADPRPDNKAREADEVLTQLGLMIFDQRLQDIARGENPPFLGAHAFDQPVGQSASLTALALGSTETGWKESLTAGLQAEIALLRDGIRQDELQRELTQWRSTLEAEVASAATRKTAALADLLTRSVDSRDVFVTPAADLLLFDHIVASITPEKVNQALRQSFSGNGPLIFLAGPRSIEGAETVVANALQAEQGQEAHSALAPAPAAWPFDHFGDRPGEVVDRLEETDLGVTMLRFANGVRLTIKPTNFHADQILVAASLGHGRQDLPVDHPTEIWAAEAGAFIGGGLQGLSVAEIDRILAGKQLHVRFDVNDNGFLLTGSTRPQDFAAQLQLLTAYLTAPGWRPEAFQSVRDRLITALPQWQASPAGVFQRNGSALLHGGDVRWLSPDLDRLQNARLESLRDLLDPILAQAPIELVVVGDVSVEAAITAVSQTLGALPTRSAESTPPAERRKINFPAVGGAPVILHHQGRPDQGLTLVAWKSADLFGDLREPRSIRLLQLVLQQRLTDEFRTRLGGTYSPGSEIQASPDYPGFGLVMAWAETSEDKMAVFDETIARITASLRDQEISADEFERARKPRVETLLKSQQTNEYWLGSLLRAQTDEKSLAIIRTLIPDLQKATVADLQAAARRYLGEDQQWRLRITPETSAMQRGQTGE